MEIFKLFGSILIDSGEAENSIQKTDSKAKQLTTSLGNGIKTAAKWGAGIVAGATAAAGAMVAAAKGTAEALDVVDKASIRMGITAEQYQELAYAAGLSGVAMSDMEEAAKKLEGTDLGLNQAIAQLQAITDEEERTATAIELFGESAYKMKPLLNAGTEGMEAMRKEANDLGLVMSQDAVSSGAAMNDMFSKLDQTFGMVKNTIMVELMPYVMMILEWCVENLPVVADTVKRVMDRIMPIVAPVLKAVMSLFKSVFALLNGDTETFAEEFKNIWKNLAEAALGLGKSIMEGLGKGLSAAWETITGWVTEKVSWLMDKLTFWDNDDSMRTASPGFSHASGLPYVPYDNYPASLHRDEVVLTPGGAQTLLDDVRAIAAGAGGAREQVFNFSIEVGGAVVARKQYHFNEAEATRRGPYAYKL